MSRQATSHESNFEQYYCSEQFCCRDAGRPGEQSLRTRLINRKQELDIILCCLFTFAITADLLGDRRSVVSVSRRSSDRSSDLGAVIGIVGAFHSANLAKRTLTTERLVSCGSGRRQSQILVFDSRNVLPGLLSILVNEDQCLLAGSAGLAWHPGEVILIKNIFLDQNQVGITDSAELRRVKLAGTNPADGLHDVRMTFFLLGHNIYKG